MDESDEYGLLIHSFKKNAREQVRILLNEYKGTRYVDIRVFFWNGEKYLPSKKGVTLGEDKYHELLSGVLQLGETLGYDPLSEEVSDD